METQSVSYDVKVLASGYADGQKLDLVQGGDGMVTILQDGAPLDGITAGGLDTCVRLYLAILRHRPDSGLTQ